MLKLKFKGCTGVDENGMVYTLAPVSLKMEHSLIAVSKWESYWQVPFLSAKKTNSMLVDYFRFMCINAEEIDHRVFDNLPASDVTKIKEYIESPMSATTIYHYGGKKKQKEEIVTSEQIYSKMFLLSIPDRFDKIHFNRLMKMIDVCAYDQDPKKEKLGRREHQEWQRSENARRRAARMGGKNG